MATIPENWRELAAKSGFHASKQYPNELWSPVRVDDDLSHVIETFAEEIVEATKSNVVALPIQTPQVTAWMEIARTFEQFRNGELKHCDTTKLVDALNRMTAALLGGEPMASFLNDVEGLLNSPKPHEYEVRDIRHRLQLMLKTLEGK